MAGQQDAKKSEVKVATNPLLMAPAAYARYIAWVIRLIENDDREDTPPLDDQTSVAIVCHLVEESSPNTRLFEYLLYRLAKSDWLEDLDEEKQKVLATAIVDNLHLNDEQSQNSLKVLVQLRNSSIRYIMEKIGDVEKRNLLIEILGFATDC
jgi:hypothetical protein